MASGLSGLDLGIGGGLRLGGGSSPMVAGASTPGVSVAQAAYGAGATTSSSSSNGLFGTSPGHITIYAGGLALILLVVIRHSLPK
jgi:hypothetical protein